MDVAGVDHAVGVAGRLLEPVGILKGSAEDLGPGRRHGGGALVGPGEADDLVPGTEQFLHDGGPDRSQSPQSRIRA